MNISRSDQGTSWIEFSSATTSSSASTTCRRRRRARRRCASRTSQAIIEVLDAAYQEGIRTFMCTTHDRIARDLRPLPRQPRRSTRTTASIPCMPYAHKYANAVTEHGMIDALRQFLPDGRRGGRDAARAAWRWPARTSEAIMQLLVDAEMKMFHGLSHAGHLHAERHHRPAARPGHERGLPRSSPTTCASAIGAEPGFITMNMPRLLDVLESSGIDNPIVCANINKIGFRMCGGVELYEQTIATRRFRPDRDVGAGLGRDRAARGDRVRVPAAAASSPSSSARRAGQTSGRPRR